MWVYFWLVVPFLSAVLGDTWRWLNPFRTIAEFVNGEIPEQPDVSARVGVWPAAVVHSAEAVRPKGGYDQVAWHADARLVSSEDLETDNTLLCRLTIDRSSS